MIVAGLVSLFALAAFAHIAGNIYGGILGAYRLRLIAIANGRKWGSHLDTIRIGLRSWYGCRYRDGVGTYWQIDGMKIPVDGRDPIESTYRG
jgi:hypothetical protein